MIFTEHYLVDAGTADESEVRSDEMLVGDEVVELVRSARHGPLITVDGAPYSVPDARQLAAALVELARLAEQ